MSYSKCFACGAENFSGNETLIIVKRKTVDKEKYMSYMHTWKGYVCDECMKQYEELIK